MTSLTGFHREDCKTVLSRPEALEGKTLHNCWGHWWGHGDVWEQRVTSTLKSVSHMVGRGKWLQTLVKLKGLEIHWR